MFCPLPFTLQCFHARLAYTNTHPDTHISSYADDLTIITQHHKHEIATVHLQQYLSSLEVWLRNNRMNVSASKSSITLLTSDNSEHRIHPNVTLHNTPIPHSPTTTILGVTYDTGMTFRPHILNISTKAKPRLNVARALTTTTFGHSKESITTLFKQFIRPVISYANTAWSSDLAPTHINSLQRIQNTALRIATGCTQTAPISHLHEETKILPLKHHFDMRGTQFFNKIVDPAHPCHHLLNPRQTHRNIRNTPAAHFGSLYNSIPQPTDNTSMHKQIHTHFTALALADHRANTVLQSHPPEVDVEELGLPRGDRVHLSRLRCGHHTNLQSYQHRLGNTPSDLCLRCRGAPDTVEHVMASCPAIAPGRFNHNITSVLDLWERPRCSINFLRDVGLT